MAKGVALYKQRGEEKLVIADHFPISHIVGAPRVTNYIIYPLVA